MGKMWQLLLLFCCYGVQSQGINFGGSSSSSSSSSSGSSSGSKNNTSNRILGIIPGLSTGNSNTDSLINGGLLGAGLVAGAGLLNDALNPCGRRKRQATGGKIFFGGGGNTNCGNSNQNFGGSGGGGCGCQCQAGLTFTSNGQVYGDCRRPDNTGRYWCYTTGWNSNNACGDLKSSNRFPSNPWSYNACSQQFQCNSGGNRDCRGRPAGDKFYGCGCNNNGRKKRQTWTSGVLVPQSLGVGSPALRSKLNKLSLLSLSS